MKQQRVAVLGLGKIGNILLQGLLKAGLPPGNAVATVRHPERAQTLGKERAVLAPGTILTGSTPVYDLVRDRVYRRDGDRPLEIPAGAVVVPGTRGAPGASAARWGISLYAPVIVKYRDEKTDAATLLEEYLR